MRVYPEFTVDGEFERLGADGFSGSLNDRQFAFLRSRGFTNSLADMIAEYSKGFSPFSMFSAGQAGHWSGGFDTGAFSPAYLVQGRDGHWAGDMTAGGV